MQEKNIIVAISRGELRDELLLHLGQRGARIYVTLREVVLIKLLKTKTIDCILTQMILKDEDAIELILKVRDINSEVPIILIDKTGKHNQDLAARLKVTSYLKKPFSFSDIFRAVDDILNGDKIYK